MLGNCIQSTGGCNIQAEITESDGVLTIGDITGCPTGADIIVIWNTGDMGFSMTPPEPDTYEAQVICGGCTKAFSYNYALPCIVEGAIVRDDLPDGSCNLVLDLIDCENPISIEWSTGEMDVPMINTFNSGSYWADVVCAIGCPPTRFEFNVIKPCDVDFEISVQVNADETCTLDIINVIGVSNYTVQWEDGSTIVPRIISTSGFYTANLITENCGTISKTIPVQKCSEFCVFVRADEGGDKCLLTAIVTGCILPAEDITYIWTDVTNGVDIGNGQSVVIEDENDYLVTAMCGECIATAPFKKCPCDDSDNCELIVQIVASAEDCQYSIEGSNFRVEGIEGTRTARLIHDCTLTRVCESGTSTTTFEIVEIIDMTERKNGHSFSNMQDGGYLDHITLTATAPDDCFRVDLNPCTVFNTYPSLVGVFTPDANNCASELFFDSGNQTGFFSALTTVINEAIKQWEISQGIPIGSTEYYLFIETLGVNFFQINFGVAHLPGGTFIGISNRIINGVMCGDATYSRDGVTMTGISLVANRLPALNYLCEYESPCGLVRSEFYRSSGIDAWTAIDESFAEFIFQDPVNAPGTGTPVNSSCNANILTANVSGATGPVTYLWSTGGTTQEIADPGTRPVDVVASSDGCTATDEIN